MLVENEANGSKRNRKNCNPNWRADLAKADAMPRCGAKRKRTGLPCRAVGTKLNGRCRMHGGRNRGAPKGAKNGSYKDGQHTNEVAAASKAAKQSKRELKAIVELANKELDK